MSYDHSTEWQQGYEDAKNCYPRRLSQTAPYRAGYDRGISEPLKETIVVREAKS